MERSKDHPHSHFSPSMSKSRCFTLPVAWGSDGASSNLINRTNLAFSEDRWLPASTQAGPKTCQLESNHYVTCASD